MDLGVSGISNVRIRVEMVQEHHFKAIPKAQLKDIDGILIVLSNALNQGFENGLYLDEIQRFLSSNRVPISFLINLKGLSDDLNRQQMLTFIAQRGLEMSTDLIFKKVVPTPIYETFTREGLNIKRAYQQVAKNAVLTYYNKIRKELQEKPKGNYQKRKG
ncbi:MAG: hypothetical protein HWN66_11095 [Candidatus Helarchaeota archaeon]|nr:hypothetical protein [Candidatus Helarchaeota archaeon]